MSLLHDGRYYDALHTFMVRDIEYWRALAGPEPRRILELACGTGRVAIPLARDGHDVTGIDSSESMLETARAKAADLAIRFERVDMRELAFEAAFDLIVFPFNGIRLLLERADLERCLVGVRRALRPDARFALDVTMPVPEQLPAELPVTTLHHKDPLTGEPIVATHRRRYDRVAQRITLDATFRMSNGSTVTDHVVQRIYFPQELEAVLAHNGLRIVERHGNYDRSALGPQSPQLLLVTVAS